MSKGNWRDEGAEANIEVEKAIGKTEAWQNVTFMLLSAFGISIVEMAIHGSDQIMWTTYGFMAASTAAHLRSEFWLRRLKKLTRDES